jgi:cell division protein FtsB
VNGDRANRDDANTAEPGFRPLAALSFWCSLFLAAGLFAVLALAPKLRTYRELAREQEGLERQLVTTERRTEALAKVADALEHDPQFAAELARANFDASSGSEERIPVDPQLSLAAWDSTGSDAQAEHPSGHSRLLDGSGLDGPLLDQLADDRSVRTPLMAASSILLLVAFGLCGDRAPERRASALVVSRGRIRGWLADRYRKPL